MFYVIVWLSAFAIKYNSCAREVLLGRRISGNVNDSETQEVAEKAMEQLNKNISSKYIYKLVKVTKVYTQVVSGIKYYLTIIAAPTTCRKGSRRVNPTKCAIDESQPSKQFKLEVWSAPWQNIFQVTLV